MDLFDNLDLIKNVPEFDKDRLVLYEKCKYYSP